MRENTFLLTDLSVISQTLLALSLVAFDQISELKETFPVGCFFGL